MRLREQDNKMVYSDSVLSIKEALLKILDELVKVSQQIPRPENQLRKSDKQFLPEVSFEDARYRQTLGYLNPMLNNLLEPLNNSLTDLSPYEKYLNLNPAVFLRGNPIIKNVKD